MVWSVYPPPPSAASHTSHTSPMVCPRAMVFAHMCLTSTTYTLLSWLPTYFKETFPHSKVSVPSSTRGAAGGPGRAHSSPLQGWVYNMVPWLCAIPLAVGGGYVSDVLINRGEKPAAIWTNMSFYDALKTFSVFSFCFVFFCL